MAPTEGHNTATDNARHVVFVGAANQVRQRGQFVDCIGAGSFISVPYFPCSLSSMGLLIGVHRSAFTGASEYLLKVSNAHTGALLSEIRFRPPLFPELHRSADRTLVSPTSVEYINSTGMRRATTSLWPDPQYILYGIALGNIACFGPAEYVVDLVWSQSTTFLGSFVIDWAEPSPMSDEERRALLSHPLALKELRCAIQCSTCHDRLQAYSRLDGSTEPRHLNGDEHYVAHLPDRWQCRCAANKADLHYLKLGLHEVFRRGSAGTDGANIDANRLYTTKSLDVIIERSVRLIDEGVAEEAYQRLFEENQIFWHWLHPKMIFHKPKLGIKFVADFGVLSHQGVLYIIEIEKPTTSLVLARGGIHHDLQRAITQVMQWRGFVNESRQAALDCLGLERSSVIAVRYVIVAGRSAGLDYVRFRDLWHQIHTQDTTFMTFDDLVASLGQVRTELAATP